MTCQSSPLIRVVNELCLPACTLKSDFQLPRQLQFIWLHAKQTALPYFSGSSSSVEGWRQTVLKKKRKKESVLFHFISFSVLYVCRLLRSHFLCWITARKRCVSLKKKKIFVRQKKGTQNISLCISADGVMSLLLQRHAVLKCHIQRLRSWYAEKRIQQKRSGPDTCQGAGGIKHKEWSSVCLITKGLCAVLVPAAAVCSSTSLSTLSPKSLPIVRLCVVLLVLMMHGKSMELFRIYLSLSPGHDPYKQPSCPCTFIVMICHF